MVETVTARRFEDDAVGGATVPAKMECEDANGVALDVFVKFSSPACPPGGLVRDLVGCQLAQLLGLDVGRPVLVNVPPELVDAIKPISPSTAARIGGSVSPAFGSVGAGSGFLIFRPPLPPGTVVRSKVAEMWAFDQLAMNPDRNDRKPNCLIKGENIVLIDHEKALEVALVGLLAPPPWDDRWLPDPGHLVHDAVREGALPLERLKQAFKAVDMTEIREICSEVPASWDVAVAAQIERYLLDLFENLDKAFDNLRKVLI